MKETSAAHRAIKWSHAVLVVATCSSTLLAQISATLKPDQLRQGFTQPPNSAQPRVWWHWMDGNISEQGAKLDLEWMARIGIGGFTIFQGSLDTPQVVPHRLRYMTPEWKHAFNEAIDTGSRLGMEMSIASSPGWSETGGPWVPPAQAIKKLVWSETRVEGGRLFRGTLPRPSDATGTFQNFDLDKHREPSSNGQKNPPDLPTFYADAAVIAYRRPAHDSTQAELQPKVSASSGTTDVAALSDGDIEHPALSLPAARAGQAAWVRFDYGRPQTIRAVTLATTDDIISFFGFDDTTTHPLLQASDDGESFRTVADIPPSSVAQRTVSFDAVTARYFRLSFGTPASETKSTTHRITELVLHEGARVNEFEKRAGFATVLNYYTIHDPKIDHESVVSEKDVINLTSRMHSDGSLNWTPPAGTWIVLRLGQSLTGRENEPAPAEATGLEVDKMNAGYVKNYLNHYLQTYDEAAGPGRIGAAGITHFLTDSVEVGAMNWTDAMLVEFRQRRGYDASPWLPALTGVIVGSTEQTDRFLWDFRRTIGELYAQNHYGAIADELHRRGLRYYGEALEFRRPTLGDDMEMRSKADVPMGAMWFFDEKSGPNPTYVADLRGAASVAHLYGQNLVGAESLTSGPPDWTSSPNILKRIADFEFTLGVNRFEYHESAHQPLVGKAPGLTLGVFGQWFNRNETWAEQAGPWVKYLARSSYLLQQGRFFGDVAYFYGEEAPLTGVFGAKIPEDTPQGYGFDFVNSDVLLHRLRFQDGRLVSPSGTSYRILYLGGTSQRMTVPVLRKLQELVSLGAVVVGNKPVDSPSLADDQADFHRLAEQLWGAGPSDAPGSHADGKGTVYFGRTAKEVLTDLHLGPDLDYAHQTPETKLLFLHRRLDDGDLYFVDSRNEHAETVETTFRVIGRIPELWDPSTGEVRAVYYRTANGRTTVPLAMDPYGTVFVVFRKPAQVEFAQVPLPVETALAVTGDALGKDWLVTFPPDRGAPAEARLDRLISWSDSPDDGVKYFSGTASYRKTLDAPAAWFHPNAHIWLDLGTVKELAEVELNGKPMGVLWKAPFRVDLSAALRPGPNELVIKVTNLWPNRIIGDQQPGVKRTYTFVGLKAYEASSPLLPSGLLGPVRLSSVTTR